MKNYFNGYNAGPMDFGQPEQHKKDGNSSSAVTLLEEGGVRFRIYEQGVNSVKVQFDDEENEVRYPLVKDRDGYWSLELYDIPAGIHIIRWYFDGEEKLCTTAPVIFYGNSARNYIDVPDEKADCYILKDVPHGSVRREYYYSSVTEQFRICWVYTPPFYDESRKSYPVLYALNGGEENETAWLWPGKINLILDNLTAENKIEDMLVVMMAGYVFARDKIRNNAILENFSALMEQDVIPFIEDKYRVIPCKEYRAIAGNSLGASQAQWTAFNHPELFDYIGVFSGRILEELPGQRGHYSPADFFIEENADIFNAQHKLLFYARGTEEYAQQQEKEMEELKKRHIEAIFYSCEGNHSWMVSRQAMLYFLPLLFREESEKQQR